MNSEIYISYRQEDFVITDASQEVIDFAESIPEIAAAGLYGFAFTSEMVKELEALLTHNGFQKSDSEAGLLTTQYYTIAPGMIEDFVATNHEE